MKKLSIMLLSVLFISACSSTPPKVKEPTGDWIQINNTHYYEENAKPTQKDAR
ncbi:TPA: hypothetical protein RNX31_002135 [Pasteurella multocida]|nr:hypothetical protein [Pasteurella multocida]